MPAESALVPKYCLHRPSGRAYIRIHGRVIYIGEYGAAESKAEYGRHVAELSSSPTTANSLSPSSSLAVVELCAAYLDFADGYCRNDGQPTRSIEEARAAIRILTRLYGKLPVADFGPPRLLAIQASLANGGNARTYVNKLIEYIKRIFRWGVSRQIVPPNIHTSLATVDGLS